jgi:integrase
MTRKSDVDVSHEKPQLTLAQHDAFWRALVAEPNRDAAAALAVLIATGARRNEVRLATWRDVDMERGLLKVPMSRNGRPKCVRLNAFAVGILRQQLTRRKPSEAFVFPGGRRAGRPLEGLREVWERAINIAALPGDIRYRDLTQSTALETLFLEAQAISAEPRSIERDHDF